jgi:hypothetical protein
MLTVLAVTASAFVIMLLAAVHNRRRDTSQYVGSASGTGHDASASWLPVIGSDGSGSDCANSDAGSGCDGGGGGAD